MKKIAGFFVAAILGLWFLSGTAFAADKFAYVDLGLIFGEYNKTKDYDKVLGGKEDVFNTEMEKKVKEFKQFQDKFNVLSDKEKEAKKSELESKFKTIDDYRKQKGMDLRKEQDEKMKEILKDIEDAVKKYAQKEGLTFVFNDRILVYQDKSLDITSKIIDALNKGYVKR